MLDICAQGSCEDLELTPEIARSLRSDCSRSPSTFAHVLTHRCPCPTHYDVIIIGTGAGGGTLAHRLAPSGKRILLLERGDYVPREQDNWSTRAVNVDGKYQTKEHWRDKDGKELHPHTNYCVGGNTKFYGAALFRLRREDFGELRHHGGVSPAWPIDLRRAGALLHRGRAPLPGARRARRGSDRAAGERAVQIPRGQPRAADAAAERRLRPARPHPFHMPLGIMLDEKNRAAEPLHPLRHLRRASLPGVRQVRRPGGVRRSRAGVPQRHPAHRRLRLAAGDQRVRAGGDPGRGGARAASGELQRRHRRRRPAARSTPPRCCCARPATGIRAAWRTARTWSAGTTWATSTRC